MASPYLSLDRTASTLSTGEARRIRLAAQLGWSLRGVCYLLDEPTTGLHLQDVARFVSVLRRLAEQGHAVVVIEHHLDVVLGAGWVIDIGPEGSDEGGRVVYEGPPAGLIEAAERSHTGRCLKERVER